MPGSPGDVHGAVWVSPTPVLATLSIASGPPGARLASGTISLEQPELNVPSTPSSDLLAAYALPFDVHLAASHAAACAVESSQAWYPIVYLPALKWYCLSRTYWIALPMARFCARPAPCSGRSEAIKYCGFPGPL